MISEDTDPQAEVSVHTQPASADMDSTSQQECFRLFDLPQELQDILFVFANPNEDIPIILHAEWVARDLHQQKTEPSTHITRLCPPSKASEWLVSKRYFLAAARAWMGVQTFANLSRYSTSSFGRRSPVSHNLVHKRNGLFLEFDTCAHFLLQNSTVHGLRNLNSCRNLKKLTITIDWSYLDHTGDKFPWIDDLTDVELRSLLSKLSLHKLSGLQEVSLLAGHCSYANSLLRKDILAANTRRLEQTLRFTACKPRDVGAAVLPSKIQPLYHRSSVLCCAATPAEDECSPPEDKWVPWKLDCLALDLPTKPFVYREKRKNRKEKMPSESDHAHVSKDAASQETATSTKYAIPGSYEPASEDYSGTTSRKAARTTGIGERITTRGVALVVWCHLFGQLKLLGRHILFHLALWLSYLSRFLLLIVSEPESENNEGIGKTGPERSAKHGQH